MINESVDKMIVDSIRGDKQHANKLMRYIKIKNEHVYIKLCYTNYLRWWKG